MKRIAISFFGLVIASLSAQAQTVLTPPISVRPLFFAQNFGGCSWTLAGDVGSCINATIAAAAANGGGTVVLPCGRFGVTTPIVNNNSGVKVLGCGIGPLRLSDSPNQALAVTALVWNGAADATVFDVEPAGAPLARPLWAVDTNEILIECNDIAGIGFKFADVNQSRFNVGASECKSINIWVTTLSNTLVEPPGTQHNEWLLYSKSQSTVNAPTGIFISGFGNGHNVSIGNIFEDLVAWVGKGDGIVYGYADNNVINYVSTFFSPGLTSYGNPMVIASPGYIMPNGITVPGSGVGPNGWVNVNHASTAVALGGYQSNKTITPGANGCNGGGVAACGPTTLTKTSNGGQTRTNNILTLNNVTGLAVGMGISTNGDPTAGTNSLGIGVLNNSQISVVGGSTVTLANGSNVVTNIINGAIYTFSWGVKSTAVQGTYTITATGGTTFNITAPAGGTTQAGISVAAGVLAFTDMVFPWTGTATVGDTWTVVLNFTTAQTWLGYIDTANAFRTPLCEPGAQALWQLASDYYASPCTALPTASQPNALINAGSTGNTQIGGSGASVGFGGAQATGASSFATGPASAASGTGSNALGSTLSISGTFTTGTGQSGTLTGTRNLGLGFNYSDRARTASLIHGATQRATLGDTQSGRFVLGGSGTAVFRMTADRAAASGSNCINLGGVAVFSLTIDIVALDITDVTKSIVWNSWTGRMSRTSGAATTTVTMNTTPTPLAIGTGMPGSAAVAATADTTQSCLNLQFTPPNADTWNAVATVATTEATQ